MKVAYVIPTFPAPTETFATSDLVALSKLVERVLVFSLRRNSEERRKRLNEAGLRKNISVNYNLLIDNATACFLHPAMLIWMVFLSLRISTKNIALGFSALAISPRIIAIVHRIIREDVNVVHAFWGRHPALVLAVLHKFCPSRYTLSIFVGAYDLVADDELVRLGLEVADVHFTHSHSNTDYFLQKGIPDVQIVKRGIPLERLHHSAEYDRNTIVTASALDPRKRVDLVIEVISEIRKSGREASLQIIGGGNDLAQLKDLVRRRGLEDDVRFLGHLPRSEVSRVMARSQIFLFLSEKPSERLPNVIKEALFAGCYVVSSKTQGIDELLCNAFGAIVSTRNSSEIAKVVVQAQQEPYERALRRRRLANKWMASRWAADKAMEKYVQAWKAR